MRTALRALINDVKGLDGFEPLNVSQAKTHRILMKPMVLDENSPCRPKFFTACSASLLLNPDDEWDQEGRAFFPYDSDMRDYPQETLHCAYNVINYFCQFISSCMWLDETGTVGAKWSSIRFGAEPYVGMDDHTIGKYTFGVSGGWNSALYPHAKAIIYNDMYGEVDKILRGEVIIALRLIFAQLRLSCFVSHWTAPVLLFSFMGPQHARLIEAHFDGQCLVMRPTTLYDLREKNEATIKTFGQWYLGGPTGNTEESHQPHEDPRCVDVISRGLVTRENAQSYFTTYKQKFDHFIYSVPGGWFQSLDFVRQVSSLLTSVICTVGALHSNSPEYDACYDHFVALAAQNSFSKENTVYDVLAFIIGAYWLSDLSWSLVSTAVRVATELQLHRSIYQAGEDKSHYLCARVYYLVFIFDHHFSIPYGRYPLTRQCETIKMARNLFSSPHTIDDDIRLVWQVELWSLTEEILMTFGTNTDKALTPSMLPHFHRFGIQLESFCTEWNERWDLNPYISSYARKGSTLYVHLAKMYLYSHALRGLGKHNTVGREVSQLDLNIDEFANAAVLSATTIIRTVINDQEIQSFITGFHTYFHIIIVFAVVFLLKVSTAYSVSTHLDRPEIVRLVECLLLVLKRVTPSLHPRHLLVSIVNGIEQALHKFTMHESSGNLTGGNTGPSSVPVLSIYDGTKTPVRLSAQNLGNKSARLLFKYIVGASKRTREPSKQSKIIAHSKLGGRRSLYPGNDYVALPDFLQQKNVNNSPPRYQEPFVMIYNFDDNANKTTLGFNPDATGLQRFSEQSLEGNKTQLVFIRGFPSLDWLEAISTSYNVDPVLYHKHLQFKDSENTVTRSYFTYPALPSFLTNGFQLNFTTIWTDELTAPSIVPEDTERTRLGTAEHFQKYFSKLKNSATLGDSMVTGNLMLSRKYSLIDQKVSIDITKLSDSWHAVIWMDNARDLSQSFPGPLCPKDRSRTWTPYIVPIIQHRDGIVLREEINDLRPHKEAVSHWEANQNACLLPFQYGCFLLNDIIAVDALYALSEIIQMSVAAEGQVLNLLQDLLSHEMDLSRRNDPNKSSILARTSLVGEQLMQVNVPHKDLCRLSNHETARKVSGFLYTLFESLKNDSSTVPISPTQQSRSGSTQQIEPRLTQQSTPHLTQQIELCLTQQL